MNYFGISKRVKVDKGVTPRDFDRSKLFNKEVVLPPVIREYNVLFSDNFMLNIDSILKLLIGINLHSYNKTYSSQYHQWSYKIYCTDKQLEEIKLIYSYISHKEIK